MRPLNACQTLQGLCQASRDLQEEAASESIADAESISAYVAESNADERDFLDDESEPIVNFNPEDKSKIWHLLRSSLGAGS